VPDKEILQGKKEKKARDGDVEENVKVPQVFGVIGKVRKKRPEGEDKGTCRKEPVCPGAGFRPQYGGG
jgi:hypothetical protein